MKTYHRTLMDLTVTNGEVVCTDGSPFDRVAYSLFKYGYIPPAREYGYRLAALISEDLWDLCDGRPIRIISAPYKYLPTASHLIATYLLEALSIEAVQHGLEPPMLVPFHKARTGSDAYAKSNDVEFRRARNKTRGMHLDESLVTGTVFLVVDDIRITGSAEEGTATYLEPLGPYAVWYLHAAALVESAGLSNPSLEDELNQTVPHTLNEILAQVADSTFQLNTRVLRLMLQSNVDGMESFVTVAPTQLLAEMQQAAIGSGLEYYTKYLDNVRRIGNQLQLRGRYVIQPVLT